MKQQIFVMHGGNAFNTYDDYIAYLREKVIDFANFFFKDWKSRLQETLGEEYEVYLFRMPNAQNAKYLEWAIWFEKHLPFMRDGVILVGHSLGGIFLAKYLSENSFPKTIKAVFMVAAPFNEDEGKFLHEFSITKPLEKLDAQGGKIFIYHSKDDPVVGFGEMEKYQKELPNATYRIFEDRLHFNQEEFPEIVEDIRALL